MEKDDNKIALKLSGSQRNILLKYQSQLMDQQLSKLISIALKKHNKYEVYLTDGQVKDLCEQFYTVAEREKNRKMQKELDILCCYIEDCLSDLEDKFEDDEFSEYSKSTGSVYVLKVALDHTEEIWRRIAIRGGQTLDDLNNIIYDAFDREEEHLYTFYIPSKFIKSKSRNVILHSSVEYTHPSNLENSFMFDEEPDNTAEASIESLNLYEGQKFLYLFDFGDQWWHEIIVEQIDGKTDNEKYPRIIKRNGDSPPQYYYDDE